MPTTFNTTDPKPGYVYEVATDTWFPLLGIAPGSSIVRWRKTAVGAETSVSGLDDLSATLSYNAGTEQVYLNGVLLVRTEDYLATTGTSVTGLTALAASDVIEVIAFNATNVQITDALLETDINAKGDLIVGAAVDTAAILTSGTSGQVLSVNTATATGLEWVTSDDANAIQNAIVDAKGDIIAATAADTVSRLAVGANGTVLTAASGQATGLEWATPSSGAYTSLASGTLSSTSVNLTSISQSYTDLYLVVVGAYFITTASQCVFRFNSDSGASYNQWYALSTSTTPISETDNTFFQTTRNNVPTSANDSTSILYIRNYATTSAKQITATFSTITDAGGGNYWSFGSYESSTAISAISIRSSNGTSVFGGGTYTLYGVK